MASSVLLIVLVSTIIPGFYSLPTARDNSEGEQPAALLNRERRLASNCITDIYVFVHTSRLGGTGGGTNDNHMHDIKFRTSSATYKSSLFDQPGDQASIGKGDLWKLDLNDHFHVPWGTCIRKSDITYVAIEEDSNDGWLIDSVVTVIEKEQGDETLTINLDEHQWIDGDGNPNEQPGVVRIWPLNIV